MTGYAMCGSFCTLRASLLALEGLVARGLDVQPILSERVVSTSTRFISPSELIKRLEALTKRRVVCTVEDAEPFGAKCPLDELIIAPCTGNTLAKIAHGVTDTAVTMAAKAHLRCDRPTLIALATNDAMSQNLANIGTLLARKSVYLLPMRQDDPVGKPHSLVADFGRLCEGYDAMLAHRQLRPLFLEA